MRVEASGCLRIARAVQAQRGRFWEEYTRLFQPHDYKVDLSDELYRLKQSLILDERKLVK